MKFKFINREFDDLEELREFFKEVECPLPFENLPNGEYMIRGDKKSYRKEYFNSNGIWFLVENVTKDNGHYMCDAAEYLLFPQLSEKEWALLNKVPYKTLNKVWQRNLCGYNTYMGWKKLREDTKKSFLSFYRELKEEID
jgi:hypothetical protein